MAENNRITFYDLALSTGATISPFVWATKYALKHKGFDLDVVPGGFTKIPERTGGKTERLPAIVDDGQWVLDSWGIVEYLDEKYPDRQMLIPHPSVAIVTRALFKVEIADGRLIQPFDIVGDDGHAYWLVYPSGRRNVPKIRLFREWILAEVKDSLGP